MLVTLLLAGMFAIGIVPNAGAQQGALGTESGWAFSVDIPLQFGFTEDINGTAGPSGYKVALDLPFRIGVGMESYSVEAGDASGTASLTFDYEFTDIYFWHRFAVMTVAVGVGQGTVLMQPFDDGTNVLSTEKADADQSFLVLGWLLNMNWEFHVAYHQVDAVANVLVDGVLDGTTINAGGIMTAAGFKYMF